MIFTKLKYGLYILLLALFIAISLKHFKDCQYCSKTCVVYTNKSVKTCINECKCIFDNRYTQLIATFFHSNDYNWEKYDDPMCKNNYYEPPLLKKKVSSEKVPNVILFLLDDLSTIDPYFEAMTFTKELFLLNGTYYPNTFTPSPFCCTSRSSLLTGLYPHNTGVIASTTNGFASVDAFRLPLDSNGKRMIINGKCVDNEKRIMNMFLQKYGNYKTSITGKYLNALESHIFHTLRYIPKNWDNIDIPSNNYQYTGHVYNLFHYDSLSQKHNYEWQGIEQKNYLTYVVSNRSVDFIRKQRELTSDPLFLYIAPTAPHGPQTCADQHRDKLKHWADRFEEFISSRQNYHSNESIATKSNWLKNSKNNRNDILSILSGYDNSEIINYHKLEFERHMTSLYAVDEMVKNVYDKIKEIGELDNTVFIFTSDNGFNYGAHALFHKMAPYDESTKVPFYVSGVGFDKGSTDDRFVLLNDILPTFLDIMGYETPEYMDGISFKGNAKRDSVLIEYNKAIVGTTFDGDLENANEIKIISDIAPKVFLHDIPPYKAIRNNDFLFVEYQDYIENDPKFEYELYDLRNDTFQMYNVYNNEQYFHIVDKLKLELNKLINCSGKNCAPNQNKLI